MPFRSASYARKETIREGRQREIEQIWGISARRLQIDCHVVLFGFKAIKNPKLVSSTVASSSDTRVDVFREAHGWNVHDLQITHAGAIQHYYNYGAGSKFIELAQLLRPLPDASHTRNRKIAPPDSQCVPGTRQDLFSQLHSWVSNGIMESNGASQTNTTANRPPKHVLWLYGSFGCGKSAVAQSMAEEYSRRGRLAASFFFFRGAGNRSTMNGFASTLAHQISINVPGAKQLLERTVMEDPGIVEPTRSLESQIQHLVYGPLLACLTGHNPSNGGSYLLVIDGLDECGDEDGVAAFIDYTVSFLSDNPGIPLRILITSRVEEHIRTSIEEGATVIDIADLSSRAGCADIRYFMEVYFSAAQKRDRALQALGESWPAPDDLARLVRYCDGSFIFGSTMARYIIKGSGKSDTRTPVQRLALALTIHPGVDGVYAEVLSRAKHLPHFHTILSTIVCLLEPLSISAMSVLLQVTTYELLRVLVLLQAILHIPGRDDIPVTIFHTSVRDFLMDRSRSGEFHCPSTHHTYLLHRCLDLLLGKESSSNAEYRRYVLTHLTGHMDAARMSNRETSGIESLRLAYDLSMPVSRVKELLHIDFALDSSLDLPVTSELLFWEAEVKASEVNKEVDVTIDDVLTAIYSTLRQPVSYLEYELLGEDKAAVDLSYLARISRVHWETRERAMIEGVKQFDMPRGPR
ncbi:hypothetical protein NMY22_g15809 [Coprinellus aureogranulatus]|nr:hypothetical protein NMY22_g15809 [Coprinellus aureogranulatus]